MFHASHSAESRLPILLKNKRRSWSHRFDFLKGKQSNGRKRRMGRGGKLHLYPANPYTNTALAGRRFCDRKKRQKFFPRVKPAGNHASRLQTFNAANAAVECELTVET